MSDLSTQHRNIAMMMMIMMMFIIITNQHCHRHRRHHHWGYFEKVCSQISVSSHTLTTAHVWDFSEQFFPDKNIPQGTRLIRTIHSDVLPELQKGTTGARHRRWDKSVFGGLHHIFFTEFLLWFWKIEKKEPSVLQIKLCQYCSI